MRPIHEMTSAEFDALPDAERFTYPNLGGPGPSHTNYWLCAVAQHLQHGGELSQRIWDSMHKQTAWWLRHVSEPFKGGEVCKRV